MPTLDLRDRADRSKLKPLAQFELLSVMLAPRDKAKRERILDSVRRETNDQRQRRGVLDDDEAKEILVYGATRGGAAGWMMAALIQCRHHGFNPTLDTAIKLIGLVIPKLPGGGQRMDQHPQDWAGTLLRSPRKLRENFRQFGPVAHLWSAYLFDEQNLRWIAEDLIDRPVEMTVTDWRRAIEHKHGFSPTSLEKLPAFVGHANAIRSMFDEFRFTGDHEFRAEDYWVVRLPDGLIVEKRIKPLPIPEALFRAGTR